MWRAELFEIYRGVPIYYAAELGFYNVGLPARSFAGSELSEARAFIDAYYGEVPGYVPPEALPGPTLTPTLFPAEVAPVTTAETYRTVNIQYNPQTKKYGFSYADRNFLDFNTADAAKAFVDVLFAPSPAIPTIPAPGMPGAPTAAITALQLPTLPWYVAWLGPFVEYMAKLWESGVNYFGQKFADGAKAADGIVSRIEGQFEEVRKSNAETRASIDGMPSGIWEGLIGSVSDLFKKTADEGIKNALDSVKSATGSSPEWKADLENQLKPFADGMMSQILGTLDHTKMGHSPMEPEEAAFTLTTLVPGVIAANLTMWIAHCAAEAGTLGQLEAVGQIAPMVVQPLGINNIVSNSFLIPLDELLFKRARQHYASQYTPEIPPYADLQNMRMKEIIGQKEFQETLKLHGFATDWAEKLWGAHFAPPALSDILVAWRRKTPVSYPKSDPTTGTIVWVERPEGLSLDDVKYLLESIDLDPRYMDIFMTRTEIDPSLSLLRFMYETGAIGIEEVTEGVHRLGLVPEYEKATVNFVLGFQERLFRRRYLTTLLTGVIRGAYTPDELTKAVKDAGYSEGVAHWMIEIADARKKIAAYRAPVTMKARLLSPGDLTKAFERDLITEDVYRTELMVRGYEIGDVDLKVKLILGEKVVELAGGPKVALSQAELLNAWRWNEMTEDAVRIELQLRGLSPEETDILIATKKKQWTVTPK